MQFEDSALVRGERSSTDRGKAIGSRQYFRNRNHDITGVHTCEKPWQTGTTPRCRSAPLGPFAFAQGKSYGSAVLHFINSNCSGGVALRLCSGQAPGYSRFLPMQEEKALLRGTSAGVLPAVAGATCPAPVVPTSHNLRSWVMVHRCFSGEGGVGQGDGAGVPWPHPAIPRFPLPRHAA